EHPNCIVEAVSDLRPERRGHLMETYQCAKSYDSLEKLVLDPKIEAVFIATPGPDHLRHVMLAMKAGKHVMCAVPAVWGSLEECEKLLRVVKSTGLVYMMAETSYYHQAMISVRRFYKEGKFGNIFYTEAEYHHDGLEELFFEDGQRTWRHGMAPMHYPTHCTSMLIGLTGERLKEVTCIGWGDDDPILKDNAYNNPFWNETALFKTDRGNALRVAIFWKGAHKVTERAQWYGDKMSFFEPHPHGPGHIIIRRERQTEVDEKGKVRYLPQFEKYEQPQYWETDMLPPLMRHYSYHDGSHTFLTHEFVEAVLNNRRPTIDVYEAIAYTAPGIVAHESALKGGLQMKIPQFD
ncbi:MAG TPA: Gfo/Idh/MocA family oxidoreductase, partial [Acidobacteriota bacterium]|nr:Gfo/Idh/MocA family oxidoreductase [Acidobacteriota bacterium]